MVAPRRLRRLELLEHEHARALAHHEPRPRRVERPRRPRRVLLLGDEPAHRAEAGEDQRVHARLGAAGEHRVGVAAPDQLGALADRVRAGRARRDRRVVRARGSPSEIASCPHAESTSTFGMKFGETRSGPRSRSTSRLLHDPDEAADRGAEDDPDAVGVVRPSSAGVGRPPPRRAEREQHVAVELAHLLRRGDPAGSKSLTSAAIAHRELARVERADPVDAAPPLDRGRPTSTAASLPIGVTAPSPVTATLRTMRA